MVRTRGGSRLRPRVRFSTPEREAPAPAPVPAPIPSPVPEAVDRPKTRCVKYVPKCASVRVAPSNIVYLSYGYRSTGKGVLTTEIMLIR